MEKQPHEALQALVLHDVPLVVDLIELTLNHGLFVVSAAATLAEAEAILATMRPDLAIVDMDNDDSTAVMQRVGTSATLDETVTPVLGLARRGDLKTKLRAFDLGADDILTVPFSPKSFSPARSSSPGVPRAMMAASCPRSPSARSRSTSSIASFMPVRPSCT